MTTRTILLAVCCVMALVPAANIVFLFLRRAPCLAVVTESDYSEANRGRDQFWFSRQWWNGFRLPSGGYRPSEVVLRYTWDDIEYLKLMTVRDWRGRAPLTAHIIWIDPDDPRRATANGPGYWLSLLLVVPAVAMIVWFFAK